MTTAIDRAHAKRTKKALTQTKAWNIDRVPGDRKCAKRLQMITSSGGIVWDARLIVESNTWVICWWTWHDDEGSET